MEKNRKKWFQKHSHNGAKINNKPTNFRSTWQHNVRSRRTIQNKRTNFAIILVAWYGQTHQ